MNKNTKFDKPTDWYELWMQQSRAFFESADEHLKTIFASDGIVQPEENLKQINTWLESLKSR